MGKQDVRRVIVVGAGSAGSVVARRLSDAGAHVTVLEAGGEDTNPAIHDPARAGELWHSPDDWDYFTVPQPYADNRELHLPRGKVLGGSHALNAMIWVRCAPQDFDDWARIAGPEWSWDSVLPVYRDIENFSGGASELHGDAGLLPVTDDYALDPIQAAIIDAAVQEGLPRNPDYNSGVLDGVSQQQVTMQDGQRANTYMTYLAPVRDAVEVITGAWVHDVLLEKTPDGVRAVGVRYARGGEIVELHADEVVLAAGALDSPRVLLRSGIGPADELTALGIESVVDLPGVGKNLQDHLLAPVIFTTQAAIEPPRSGVSVTQSHLFWRSHDGLDRPDTQPIHFSVPMYKEEQTGPDSGFTLMGGLVTPRSRGSVTLSGANANDPILIDLDALHHEDDIASLVASVQQCRRIGTQPALAASVEDGGWGAVELFPGPDVGDAEIEAYVRHTAATYHHQVGTCAMGTAGASVVSPTLKVHGVMGLRVIDASVMPTLPAGNTNAPSVLIGELGSRFILEDR